MDSNEKGILLKLIIWIISFPISFTILTILSIFEYFWECFNLPTDLWDIIGGKEIDEET